MAIVPSNNHSENKQAEIVVPSTANEAHKMSPLDIVDLLLQGKFIRAWLTKEQLIECTGILKERGFSNLEIGRVLSVTKRTVCTYLESFRSQNSIVASLDFQKNILGEALNNFRSQYYRLIKLSHSEHVPEAERVRAIFAACQVQKNMIEMLEKFGYLSEKITDAEMQQLITETSSKNKTIGGLLGPFQEEWSTLTEEQRFSVMNYKLTADKETEKNLAELINQYSKESSYLFFESEFKGEFTTDKLISGITGRGILVPSASTHITSLNKLLRGKAFYWRFSGIDMSWEVKDLIRRLASLHENEYIKLNRLVLEEAFPRECPKSPKEEYPYSVEPSFNEPTKKDKVMDTIRQAFEKEIYEDLSEVKARIYGFHAFFKKDEFHGQFTVEGLLAAIRKDGILVPSASEELEALNELLTGNSLRKSFPNVNISEKAQYLINKNKLDRYGRIYLNRLLLEDAYLLKCPRMCDRPKDASVSSPETEKPVLPTKDENLGSPLPDAEK